MKQIRINIKKFDTPVLIRYAPGVPSQHANCKSRARWCVTVELRGNDAADGSAFWTIAKGRAYCSTRDRFDYPTGVLTAFKRAVSHIPERAARTAWWLVFREQTGLHPEAIGSLESEKHVVMVRGHYRVPRNLKRKLNCKIGGVDVSKHVRGVGVFGADGGDYLAKTGFLNQAIMRCVGGPVGKDPRANKARP